MSLWLWAEEWRESWSHLLSHLWVLPAQESRGSGSSGLGAWGLARAPTRTASPPPAGPLRFHMSQTPLLPGAPTGATRSEDKPKKGPVNSEDTSEASRGTRDGQPAHRRNLRNTATPLPGALPRKKPCAGTAAQLPLGADVPSTPETPPGVGGGGGTLAMGRVQTPVSPGLGHTPERSGHNPFPGLHWGVKLGRTSGLVVLSAHGCQTSAEPSTEGSPLTPRCRD